MIQRRIIPQQRQNVHNHKAESSQSNHVWRHPHGKALDHHVGIERFENIATEQRMVDAAVFVFLEAWEFVLAHVDHDCDSVSEGNMAIRCK